MTKKVELKQIEKVLSSFDCKDFGVLQAMIQTPLDMDHFVNNVSCLSKSTSEMICEMREYKEKTNALTLSKFVAAYNQNAFTALNQLFHNSITPKKFAIIQELIEEKHIKPEYIFEEKNNNPHMNIMHIIL